METSRSGKCQASVDFSQTSILAGSCKTMKNKPEKLSAFKCEHRAKIPQYYASAIQVLCKCYLMICVRPSLRDQVDSRIYSLKASILCFVAAYKVRDVRIQ